MNAEQLKRIMPYATLANIRKYLPFLNELMPKSILIHHCGKHIYSSDSA
mgnify:CR=1 FL=1